MSTSFPTAVDGITTLPTVATGADNLNATGQKRHDTKHNTEDAAIIAIENKMGVGATTPVANTALVATGTGTSAWGGVTYPMVGAAAWTPITPTAAQLGALTLTVGACRQVTLGKLATVWCGLTITASGTSGNPITVTLPVGSRPLGTINAAGTFEYVRVSSGSVIYDGICSIDTSGLVSFKIPFSVAPADTRLGVATTAFGAANSDTLQFTLTFELA